jgi:hypothetical protein
MTERQGAGRSADNGFAATLAALTSQTAIRPLRSAPYDHD